MATPEKVTAPRELIDVYASANSASGTSGQPLDAVVYFDFVSTGTGFTDRGCSSNAPYRSTWNIEGVDRGLNPGNITYAGNKVLRFVLDPAENLVEFNCTTNTLVGLFPDISRCVSLTLFDIGSNSITGSICNLDNARALQYLSCANNVGLGGLWPSLANNVALLGISARGCAFTGAPPSIATCTLIQSVDIAINSFNGSIPAFGANAALTSYNCRTNTTISGNIPSLSTCTTLASFFGYDNSLTGVVGGFAVPASLTTFDVSNNLLTQAAVDAILLAFVTAGASGAYTLNVNGTGNAVPSLAGQSSKSTLQGRGWTVGTN
jgi:hypothetical protein